VKQPHKQIYSEIEQRGIELFWQDLEPQYAEQFQTAKILIDRVAAGSPYLRTLILQNAAFMAKIFREPTEQLLQAICADCDALSFALNYETIEIGLRQNKAKKNGMWSKLRRPSPNLPMFA
jgi:hypothetical protein